MAEQHPNAAERGVSIETIVSDLADFTFVPEAWDAAIAIFCHLPPRCGARCTSP